MISNKDPNQIQGEIVDELEELDFDENDELIHEENEGNSSDIKEDDTTKKTSNLQTAWNIMNLIQGMGVLGIPYAVRVGGLLVIPDIIFIGILTSYTSKTIIACQYDKIKDDGTNCKVRRGYAAIGQDVWKNYGSKIISITQLTHLFGACVLYLLLISNFIEDCFIDLLGTRSMCMVTSGVILIPTVFLSNMKQISWLSMISVCLINLTFFVLSIHSFIKFDLWRVKDIPLFDFQGFSIAHSIVIFSFVVHPYVPRIEDGMRQQSNFNRISNISFALATVVKTIFGISLAFRYGDSTRQKITQNLEIHEMRKAMGGCLAFVGYYSFPMPAAVITNIIQKADIPNFQNIFPYIRMNRVMSWSEKYIDSGMRTVLLLLTVLTAMVLPEFSLLMAIFGSCTAMLLTIIFPAWFYQHLKTDAKKFLCHCIVMFGIISGVVGFINSMIKLQEALKKDEK